MQGTVCLVLFQTGFYPLSQRSYRLVWIMADFQMACPAFEQSVGGLAKGSQVAYSGVPVGQVERIKLWEKDPQFVKVRVQIDPDTPILLGTTASISMDCRTASYDVRSNPAALRMNDAQHQARHPGELGFTYLTGLIGNPAVWVSKWLQANLQYRQSLGVGSK